MSMERDLTMTVGAKLKGDAKAAFRPLENAAAESGKKISNSLSESQDAVLKKIKSVEERLGKIGSGMKLGEDIFEKAFGLSNVDKVMGRVKGQIEFQMRDLQRVAMKLTPEMDARPLEMTLRRLEGQVKQFAGLTKQGLADAFGSFGRASGGLQQVLVGTSILGSGDQSIEAIIAKMLKVNAVFDVIKGGKEIVTGLVGGFVNAGKAAAVFNTATELSRQMGNVSAVVTERLRGQAAATDQLTASTVRLNAARGVTTVGSGSTVIAGQGGPVVPAAMGGVGVFRQAAFGVGGSMLGGSVGYGLGGDLGGIAGGMIGGFGAPALASHFGVGSAGAGLAGLAAPVAVVTAAAVAAGAALVLLDGNARDAAGSLLQVARDSKAALDRQSKRIVSENEMFSTTGFRPRDFDAMADMERRRPFEDRRRSLNDQINQGVFTEYFGNRARSDSILANFGMRDRQDSLSDAREAFFRNPTGDGLGSLQDAQRGMETAQRAMRNPEFQARRAMLQDQLSRANGEVTRFSGADRLEALRQEEMRLRGQGPTATAPRTGEPASGSWQVRGNREVWVPSLVAQNPRPAVPAEQAQRQARIGQIQEEQDRLTREMRLPATVGIGPAAVEASRLQDQAVQRQLELKRQLNQLEREERQFKLQNLETIRESNRELEKAAKTAAESMRIQQRSNMSSFGLMDETDQLRTLDIQQRLAQGGIGTLSRDEISFAQGSALLRPNLEQYGLDQARNTGLYQQIERLSREGVTSVPDQLANLDRLAQQSRETRVRVENEIRMQVSAEPEEMSRAVTERLVPILDRLVERITTQITQSLNRMTAEELNRRQQQIGGDPSAR